MAMSGLWVVNVMSLNLKYTVNSESWPTAMFKIKYYVMCGIDFEIKWPVWFTVKKSHEDLCLPSYTFSACNPHFLLHAYKSVCHMLLQCTYINFITQPCPSEWKELWRLVSVLFVHSLCWMKIHSDVWQWCGHFLENTSKCLGSHCRRFKHLQETCLFEVPTNHLIWCMDNVETTWNPFRICSDPRGH